MKVTESPGSVTEHSASEDLIVVVHRAEGKKCERCWNYSIHVGENKRYPTVCERCIEALSEIEADAPAPLATKELTPAERDALKKELPF